MPSAMAFSSFFLLGMASLLGLTIFTIAFLVHRLLRHVYVRRLQHNMDRHVDRLPHKQMDIVTVVVHDPNTLFEQKDPKEVEEGKSFWMADCAFPIPPPPPPMYSVYNMALYEHAEPPPEYKKMLEKY